MRFGLSNVKLGPKLIAGFLVVAMFSGVIGIFGIYEFNKVSEDAEEIRDYSWAIAEDVIFLEESVDFMMIIALEYMLGEFEVKADLADAEEEFEEAFSDLQSVLGADFPLLVEIDHQYEDVIAVLKGNATHTGLFDLVDHQYDMHAAILTLEHEMDVILYDLTEQILVLEHNAESEELGYDNPAVAGAALELCIVVWEATHIADEYLLEEDDEVLLSDKNEVIWHINDPSNPDNVETRLVNLEALINTALEEKTVAPGSELVLAQVKIDAVEWADHILDPNAGLFKERDEELAAKRMTHAMELHLDDEIHHLHTELAELEAMSAETMTTDVNEMVEISSTSAILMVAITAISVTCSIIIGVIFARSISKPITKVAQISDIVSKGDLTPKIDIVKRADEIGVLQNSFRSLIEFLKPTVSQIAASAEQLSSSSQEMASSAEEVNASSEEITSIAQQLSTGAGKQTEQIDVSLQQAEDLQKEFNEKIKGIEMAAELIENIAGQVNILALNASIEAARAGEYGRGFAVVADNVRRLATDTRQSLVDVNTIIGELRTSLSDSIGEIATSIQSVASISQETAASSEEASAATEQQTATMQEMTASAQELANVAVDLDELTKKFTL